MNAGFVHCSGFAWEFCHMLFCKGITVCPGRPSCRSLQRKQHACVPFVLCSFGISSFGIWTDAASSVGHATSGMQLAFLHGWYCGCRTGNGSSPVGPTEGLSLQAGLVPFPTRPVAPTGPWYVAVSSGVCVNEVCVHQHIVCTAWLVCRDDRRLGLWNMQGCRVWHEPGVGVAVPDW